MLGAVLFGHEQLQAAIDAIKAMAAAVGKPAWDWQAAETDSAVQQAVEDAVADDVVAAYQIADKQDRQNRLSEIKADVVAKLAVEEGEEGASEDEVKAALGALEKHTVRSRILEGEPRIDGRDTRTVRDLT